MLINACQGNPSVLASSVVAMHNVAAMVNFQNKHIGNEIGAGRDATEEELWLSARNAEFLTSSSQEFLPFLKFYQALTVRSAVTSDHSMCIMSGQCSRCELLGSSKLEASVI